MLSSLFFHTVNIVIGCTSTCHLLEILKENHREWRLLGYDHWGSVVASVGPTAGSIFSLWVLKLDGWIEQPENYNISAVAAFLCAFFNLSQAVSYQWKVVLFVDPNDPHFSHTAGEQCAAVCKQSSYYIFRSNPPHQTTPHHTCKIGLNTGHLFYPRTKKTFFHPEEGKTQTTLVTAGGERSVLFEIWT